MRVALVTPLDAGIHANPGWRFITAGIRWVVRCADPTAEFIEVSMLDDRPDDWRAASTCDATILCGNPRFSMSTGLEYWESTIWERLVALDMPVIDAWAGSAFPFSDLAPTVDEMAVAIGAFPGRSRRLQLAARIPHHITRDATMQRIYEAVGIASVLLPCSSWWAADDLAVRPEPEKRFDAIVLYRMAGHAWVPDALIAAAARMSDGLPVRIIAPTCEDFEWADPFVAAELVSDPVSLLRVLAGARRVLSFRIHSAIPAASVGARVAVVSIDSRSTTCDPFGIPAVRFTELAAWTPYFAQATTPDLSIAVATMRGMLCP